jgi:hypothetical protein
VLNFLKRKGWTVAIIIGCVVASIVVATRFPPVSFATVWTVRSVDEHNGLVTALATVFLAYITLRLVRVARDQSVTTRAQLRAYVAVKDADITGLAVGETPVASITFRNSGQTPAYDFYNLANMDIGISPLPEGAEPPSPFITLGAGKAHFTHLGVGILGPSNTANARSCLNGPLTQEEVDSLKSGRSAIYVYGNAWYRDAFGEFWKLSYRYVCGGVTKMDYLYAHKIQEEKSNEREHSMPLRLAGKSAVFGVGQVSEFSG